MIRTLIRQFARAGVGHKQYVITATSAPGGAATTCVTPTTLIHTDLPTNRGGNASAPEPVELLLASLAGCEAATANYVARKMKIKLGSLSFRIEAERDERGALSLPITKSPPVPSRLISVSGEAVVGDDTVASDDELKLLEKITHERCPVANMMIAAGTKVNVNFVRRQPHHSPQTRGFTTFAKRLFSTAKNSNTGVPSDWASLDFWDSYHERCNDLDWFTDDKELLLRVVDEVAMRGKRILHVGPGTSFLCELLERDERLERVVHVEASPAAAGILRRRLPDAEIVERDVRLLDFVGEFDCVVDKGFIDVFVHGENKDDDCRAVLKAIHSALVDGGTYLQVTNDALEARESLFISKDRLFDVVRMKSVELDSVDNTVNLIMIAKK